MAGQTQSMLVVVKTRLHFSQFYTLAWVNITICVSLECILYFTWYTQPALLKAITTFVANYFQHGTFFCLMRGFRQLNITFLLPLQLFYFSWKIINLKEVGITKNKIRRHVYKLWSFATSFRENLSLSISPPFFFLSQSINATINQGHPKENRAVRVCAMFVPQEYQVTSKNETFLISLNTLSLTYFFTCHSICGMKI